MIFVQIMTVGECLVGRKDNGIEEAKSLSNSTGPRSSVSGESGSTTDEKYYNALWYVILEY